VKISAASNADHTAGKAYTSSSVGQPVNPPTFHSLVVPPVRIGMYGMSSTTADWIVSKYGCRASASSSGIVFSASSAASTSGFAYRE
jgi:hypothetical protein